MNRIMSLAGSAMLVTVTAACASHKETAAPTQPAPQAMSSAAPAVRRMAAAPAVPDVAGEWAWTANIAGTAMEGAMHIEHVPAGGYSANILAQGMTLPIRDFELSGRAYSFKVEGPDGVYTLKGILTDDKTMDGTVDGPPGPGSFKAKKS